MKKDLYETTSEEEDDDLEEEVDEDGKPLQKSNGVVDVEDLGKVMKSLKNAKVRLLMDACCGLVAY